MDDNFLIRHVPSRWLTLQPAIERVLQQWSALTSYFKKLPQSDKTVEKNDKYKVIRKLLDNPGTLLQLNFLAAVSPLFTSFLTLFQQEGPLVHLLHGALCDLYRLLLMRFIRSDCASNKTCKQLMEVDVRSTANLRPIIDMDIGETTKKTLATLKAEKHKGVLMDMQHFYITCANSLRSSLPLSNTFLEDLNCLSPPARSLPDSENCIRRIARKLPQVVNDDELTSVLNEWKLYAIDDIPVEWQVKTVSENDKDPPAVVVDKPAPIDEYWARVLNVKNAAGHKKYCTLGKVVRASLSLSHGNADVERCFSINKKVVTPDRVSLGQDAVCAVRLVKEAIRIHGDGQVSGIPVTHRMLQLARSAYSTYKDHIDKKKAENEFKRKAKEQAHEQLIEEERLKLETEKLSYRRKKPETNSASYRSS